MNKIIAFYHEILSELDFSIIGYNNIETVIDDFLEKICNSHWMLQLSNLDFISYSYSSLIDFPFKIESLTKNKYFFNSFNERSFEEFIISEYGYFRAYLKTITPATIIQTSETFAHLFDREPTAYQVLITDKDYDVVKYNHQNDLLSFEFPYTKIFKTGSSYYETKRALFQKFEATISSSDSNPIFSTTKVGNRFTNSDKITENIDTNFFAKDLICKSSLKEFHKVLVQKIRQLNDFNKQYFFNSEKENIENLINSFANSILSHGFLSFIFNITVENIPSVIFVDKTNKEKRSLGTFIIGYKHELENEDRVYFRILAQRISSILAGNVAYNVYQKQLFPNIITAASLCYGIEGVKEITHGGDSPYFPKAKALEKAKEQAKELDRLLNNMKLDNDAINKLRTNHYEVKSRIENETEYNGTLFSCIQTLRNNLEVKSTHIENSITNLGFNGKIEKLEWDASLLSAFANPIEILKTDIQLMLESIIGTTKGLKLSNCKYSIYSTEIADKQESVNAALNPIKHHDNYIIFMHEEALKLAKDSNPNWLSNHLKLNIHYVGEFFYSYMEGETRKYFDINLEEANESTVTSLNEVGNKLTNKFNAQSADFPIWYIFKFKTLIQ